MHEHRPENYAVPDPREYSNCHVTPCIRQSMVGLAIRRLRLRYRLEAFSPHARFRVGLRYRTPLHRIVSSQWQRGSADTPHGVCEPYYLCDRDGISWDFSRDRD